MRLPIQISKIYTFQINFLRKGKQVNNFYVKQKANLIFSKFTVTTSTRRSFPGLAPATGDKPYPTAREEGCTVSNKGGQCRERARTGSSSSSEISGVLVVKCGKKSGSSSDSSPRQERKLTLIKCNIFRVLAMINLFFPCCVKKGQ